MTNQHSKGNGRFVAKCAAVLPGLWLVLLLLALPFPGGHPSLTSFVLLVPASLSLTGRAMIALAGEPGTSGLSLTALVLGTVVELGFVGVMAGLGARSLLGGDSRRRSIWLGCVLLYAAGHVFVGPLLTSRAATRVVLSVGSPELRHMTLERIARAGDRRYRGVLLSALEKGSEPDVDEDIIATLTMLEDGTFWHGYITSPRGARWGLSFLSKVLCDLSNKSAALERVPGVDFRRLPESFASLNGMVFERMVTELPDRPELLNPIFGIGLNNPALGRAQIDRLFEILHRPSIAKCVHLPMSYRTEWSAASHPKHRLYELATATCQDFTKEDLQLWLSHAESPEESIPASLNATALCQFVINTEGRDRQGRPR
jgi:hypothetical protein